jgi:hypothetical protein
MCPGGKGRAAAGGDVILSMSESYLGRRSADVTRSADVSRWKGAGSSRGDVILSRSESYSVVTTSSTSSVI